MAEPDVTTGEVVQIYYDCLRAGPDRFDPGRLRTILAPELDFEGPIAGHRVGADPFLAGVAGFVATVQDLQFRHLLCAGDRAATLYDATLPGGTVRFAEFFEIEHGRITSLRLLYDAGTYTASGGR